VFRHHLLKLSSANYTSISFLFLKVILALKKHRYSIGLEIMPQNPFIAISALLPSANYSAECPGQVWELDSDSNDRLMHFLKFEASQTPIKVCSRLPHRPRNFKFFKSVTNGRFYLHWAVLSDWTGSTAHCGHITAFFKRQRNPLRAQHGVYFL
jgi:hypothetical protein